MLHTQCRLRAACLPTCSLNDWAPNSRKSPLCAPSCKKTVSCPRKCPLLPCLSLDPCSRVSTLSGEGRRRRKPVGSRWTILKPRAKGFEMAMLSGAEHSWSRKLSERDYKCAVHIIPIRTKLCLMDELDCS